MIFFAIILMINSNVIFSPWQGHPFMVSLTENKPLLYSLMFSGAAIVTLASGILPDISHQFEIIELEPEVSRIWFHHVNIAGKILSLHANH